MSSRFAALFTLCALSTACDAELVHRSLDAARPEDAGGALPEDALPHGDAPSPPLDAGEPSPTAAEIEDALSSRRQQLLDWSAAIPDTRAPKYRPYDVLALTARDGCGPPEHAAYMASLGSIDFGIDDNFFALPPLVRYLFQYGACLSDAQRAELLAGLTQRHDLFAHGTTNHAIMQASSWYLLAQYFPDATWTNRDGARHASSEVMARLRDLLGRRTEHVFAVGHDELLSTTYAIVDVYPVLNLVDFADDPDVVRRADAEASLEVLVLRAHSFHGSVAPPFTRRNIDQHNAAWPEPTGVFPSITQHLLWYYFGEPDFGAHDFIQSRREPFYVIMLALSAWRPPRVTWRLPTAGYEARLVTPEFTHWDDPAPTLIYGDAYFGRDYVLSTGNTTVVPGWYSDHNQTFSVLFRSAALDNRFECQHPYWRSDHGEDAWGPDRTSPFVQSHRLDPHRAVLVAQIPAADPWVFGPENRFFVDRDGHRDALLQMVQCRIPRDVDESRFEDRWLFVRHGSTFLAVASLAGSMEHATGLPEPLASRWDVIKIRRARTALFVMVEDGAGSFDDFIARARAALPRYDERTSTVTSVDGDGEPVTVRFRIAPDPSDAERFLALPEVRIAGVERAPGSTPVLDTPFLRIDEGVLRVTGPEALEIRP